jgi:uncharacterized protein YdeI (YjbR/CyaY-like superfamily)
MKTIPAVDKYILTTGKWEEALILLREIVLFTRVEESLKWGRPIYTFQGKNVLGISAFKSYVGLWFMQGALLKDEHHKLINAQEGVTKALRQWRFGSVEEIQNNAEIIRNYIEEAILNQQKGLVIKPEKSKQLVIPEAFYQRLKADSILSNAFDLLTDSKKREYAEYIQEAKRTETREKRLDKICPMILTGIGLNERYKR